MGSGTNFIPRWLPVAGWAHSLGWAHSRWAVMGVATAVSAALLVSAALSPNIDLSVSGYFHLGGYRRFLGTEWPIFEFLRDLFRLSYIVAVAVAIAGLIITRDRSRTLLRLAFSKWLFLAVCLAMGPGVVANLSFKDQWGRPRPRDIVEFGGTKTFTPAFSPSNQCTRNCSFVSGEAASIFTLFFALAFMWPARWRLLVVTGLAAGSAAGLIRIAQGAHFVSDVVFAGVFMALTVVAIHAVFEAIALSARTEPLPARVPPYAILPAS